MTKVTQHIRRNPCIRQRISESNFTQPHKQPSESEVSAIPDQGVTSHRQPRQCRGGQGPKTVKGVQSDPELCTKTVIRLCSECLPGAQKL